MSDILNDPEYTFNVDECICSFTYMDMVHGGVERLDWPLVEKTYLNGYICKLCGHIYRKNDLVNKRGNYIIAKANYRKTHH